MLGDCKKPIKANTCCTLSDALQQLWPAAVGKKALEHHVPEFGRWAEFVETLFCIQLINPSRFLSLAWDEGTKPRHKVLPAAPAGLAAYIPLLPSGGRNPQFQQQLLVPELILDLGLVIQFTEGRS